MICPGQLRDEGPNSDAGVDLGLLELWCHPLSSNDSACSPKSMGYILASAPGAPATIIKGLRVFHAPSSTGGKSKLLVVVATNLFTRRLEAHLKGVPLAGNLIPSFVDLIDLSATSAWSSASQIPAFNHARLSSAHSNCRLASACFTLKSPSPRSFVTLPIESWGYCLVKDFEHDEVPNFTLSGMARKKDILLASITSMSSTIEPYLSSMFLGVGLSRE